MRCIELSRPTLGEAPLLELAPTLARGQVASIHRDAESEEVQGPIACCTEMNCLISGASTLAQLSLRGSCIVAMRMGQ